MVTPALGPAEIAAAVNISTRYLHKLFEADHQTVSLYIKGLRLDQARRDLLDPRLVGRPISAIAYSCGFGALSGFTAPSRRPTESAPKNCATPQPPAGRFSVPAATSGEEVRMTERAMPGGSGDERSLLDGWLDYYRATLLAKCEGLASEQLVARSCEPSPMSLIGLVRHMTEMERMYGHRLADWGTDLLYCTDEDEDADFEGVTAAGVAEDLETFRAHCARTREIMAARELGDTFGKTSSYTTGE